MGQSDTTKNLSVKQVDSLIRFAESVKTLRERFDVSIKEAAHFKSAFETEKENRAKDAADYKIIIDSYAAIETSNRIEIAGLKKEVKSQVRQKRFWQAITGAALAGIIYSIFTK